MPRKFHSLRCAASVLFLLLMISLQAGKLFHAAQHVSHANAAVHSSLIEKHHGPHITTTACAACEFEFCREAIPEAAILLKEIAAHCASTITPDTVTIIQLPYSDADWRGPPSC